MIDGQEANTPQKKGDGMEITSPDALVLAKKPTNTDNRSGVANA